MDEVPAGGELRLVEPKVIAVEGTTRETIVPEGTTIEVAAPAPSRRTYDDGGHLGGSDDGPAQRLAFAALALLLVTWLIGRRYA